MAKEIRKYFEVRGDWTKEEAEQVISFVISQLSPEQIKTVKKLDIILVI